MQSDSTATKGGLNAEDVASIRKALLIGLHSYGEVMRLMNAAAIARMGNQPIPENMDPIDPTGDANTICDFADALRSIEHGEVAHG